MNTLRVVTSQLEYIQKGTLIGFPTQMRSFTSMWKRIIKYSIYFLSGPVLYYNKVLDVLPSPVLFYCPSVSFFLYILLSTRYPNSVLFFTIIKYLQAPVLFCTIIKYSIYCFSCIKSSSPCLFPYCNKVFNIQYVIFSITIVYTSNW